MAYESLACWWILQAMDPVTLQMRMRSDLAQSCGFIPYLSWMRDEDAAKSLVLSSSTAQYRSLAPALLRRSSMSTAFKNDASDLAVFVKCIEC